MAALVAFLQIAAVFGQQLFECGNCKHKSTKCVGEGEFCVADLFSVDFMDPCDGASWQSCPICKGPNMRCYNGKCRPATAGLRGSCADPSSNFAPSGDYHSFCQDWLTCDGGICKPNEFVPGARGYPVFVGHDEACKDGESSCIGDYQVCQTSPPKCKFIPPGNANNDFLDGAPGGKCVTDNDCKAGYYCPPDSEDNTDWRTCLLDYVNDPPEGGILGAPCTSMGQCGGEYMCRFNNPYDPDNTTATCQKRFSRGKGEPCSTSSFMDCKKGLLCMSYGVAHDCQNAQCSGICEEEDTECAGEECGNCGRGQDCKCLAYALPEADTGTWQTCSTLYTLAREKKFQSSMGAINNYFSCLTKPENQELGCKVYYGDSGNEAMEHPDLERTIKASCSRQRCNDKLPTYFLASMGLANYTCGNGIEIGDYVDQISAASASGPQVLVVSLMLMALSWF